MTRRPTTSNKDAQYLSHCRVRTEAQGRSGLGLEAQWKAVADYVTVANRSSSQNLPKSKVDESRTDQNLNPPFIFEMRRTRNGSVRHILRELRSRGIRTARGGEWHPQAVNVLLKWID